MDSQSVQVCDVPGQPPVPGLGRRRRRKVDNQNPPLDWVKNLLLWFVYIYIFIYKL